MPVRAYAAADSDALKALERRVTQGGLCVQSYTRFLGDYDCRVRQYAQGFVLVFEDEQGGALLGVVSVALKDVRWPAERRMLRLGWLFDLRVDPTARRRHIASQLTAAAEGRARELGAELMLLSVNGNNRPAKALYQRTGYALVSVRKPAVFHMLRERAVPPRVGDAKVVVESVTSPRAAAQILDAALRDVALAVEPMAGVCENPGFVCTVRATLADGGGGARSGGKDGGAEREADAVSEGGVSLWISPLSQFDVAKVMGLPVRVW
jgi:GNAT superfamily N-acetyltransferase